MDERTYPYDSPDYDMPSSQPMLLDEVWGAVEDRLRAAQAQAAAQAEADRRAADVEQARNRDTVDDGGNALDILLPFATPPGAALTF